MPQVDTTQQESWATQSISIHIWREKKNKMQRDTNYKGWKMANITHTQSDISRRAASKNCFLKTSAYVFNIKYLALLFIVSERIFICRCEI